MRAPQYQQTTNGAAPVSARLQAPQVTTGVVGEALQNAAEALHQFNAAKEKRDELAAHAESGEAALSFQDQAGQIMADATSAKGLSAQPAHKAADEALLKAQEKLMADAKTPRARELIRQQTNAYMVGYRADLAKHESTQVFAAATDTLGAQAEAAQEAAAQGWKNPTTVAAQVQIGRDAKAVQGRLLGKSPEVISQETHDYESGVHRNIVERLYAAGDNDAALDYAKANLGQMNIGDQTSIMAMLKATAQNREAADDAAWATGRGAPVPVAAPGAKFTPPVRNGHVTDGFGVPRPGGRAHNGVDFAAPEGTSVTPVAAGTVVATGQDPRSGKYVIVDHGGGLVSTYSHLARQDVKGGDKVGPDTALGPVGLTGHTTGPHTHVVMRLNGKPVDPMQYIGQSAPSAGAAGQWDKGSAYAAIDKRADWSFERKERAKAKVDEEFARKDSIQARAEREADDEAKRVVIGLGDRFTSFNQIPKNVRDAMSIDAVGHFMDTARANAAPKPVAANGAEFLRLQRLSVEDPDAFAQIDLNKSAAKLTPSEFAGFDKDQAKLRAGGETEKSLRSAISGHINTFATEDMGLTGPENKQNWLKVYRLMEFNLRAATQGKRDPTDRELDEAFSAALRPVTVQRPGWLWGTNATEVPSRDVTVADIPQSELGKIDQALRKNGMPVTDANRVGLYTSIKQGKQGQ